MNERDLLRKVLRRLEDHQIGARLQKDIRAALASAPAAEKPIAQFYLSGPVIPGLRKAQPEFVWLMSQEELRQIPSGTKLYAAPTQDAAPARVDEPTKDQLDALQELTDLSQEMGLYDTAQPAAGAVPARVYLVATGETHNGQETYTRHDKPVPLADQEVLYAAPPAPADAVAALDKIVSRCAVAAKSGNLIVWDVMEIATKALTQPTAQPAPQQGEAFDRLMELVLEYQALGVAWEAACPGTNELACANSALRLCKWKICQMLAATHPAQPAERTAPDMRAICEALGFDPTNHHNAAKCPYCRPAEQAGEDGT